MPSAQVLHLLTAPPQATPPDPSVSIAAAGLVVGNLTAKLLDPAVPSPPLIGNNQIVQGITLVNETISTVVVSFILGRWLTRPLPAQTIGAGTWKIAAAVRITAQTGTSGANFNLTDPGIAVAQWRPGTGVIARAVDTAAGGTQAALSQVASTTVSYDHAHTVSYTGTALTLSLGDCLVVELRVGIVLSSGSYTFLTLTSSVLLGGLGQYYNLVYSGNSLTDTDAVLVAPAAITFS